MYNKCINNTRVYLDSVNMDKWVKGILILILLFCSGSTMILLNMRNTTEKNPTYTVDLIKHESGVRSSTFFVGKQNFEEYHTPYILLIDYTGYLGKSDGNYGSIDITQNTSTIETISQSQGKTNISMSYKYFSWSYNFGDLSPYEFDGQTWFSLYSYSGRFSFAVILKSDLSTFMDGYYNWQNNKSLLTVDTISRLLTYSFIGLFTSLGILMFFEIPLIKKWLTTDFRTRIDKSIGLQRDPPVQTHQTLYMDGRFLSHLPCCIQTARLGENYCLCGRAVSTELLEQYAPEN